MALVVKDRVKETSTTTGTGAMTLAGAVDGFQTFSSTLTNGDTTYYAIVDLGTGEFEVGLGTYNSTGNTLSRNTVLETSNGLSLINFQAGEKEVFITYPADKAVYLDAAGNVAPTTALMNTVKANDGAGSGVDADLLDGLHGSDFVLKAGDTISGNLTVTGDLTVTGTTVTINATELAIADNMIYMNEGSTVTNPDLGWSGNYNDGTYAHAGFFRDATDGRFKAYDGYTPEPDASPYIDTSHASFSLADIEANTFHGNLSGNASTATKLATARTVTLGGDLTGNVSFDGSANVTLNAYVTDDSHNHVISNVDGLQAALDAKADDTTTISAGTGLTGGGSIGVNRTLALDTAYTDGRYVNATGDSMTGDLTFGDNNKAIFGAGSDLQIYHDGSNSYIEDVGTGSLYIKSDGAGIALNGAANSPMITAFSGGAVVLAHNASTKLATTSTGVDVTGNITVSGTVDGRDVAADGTKLDGIEAGATADQTAAEILTAVKTVDGSGSGLDADLLDGQHGSYYYSPANAPDPVITLTGAVTGSGTMTNLGNVSIATTATADPTLTINGDASGSATFTNLGNATLTLTVADDSHNHVISNVDGLQAALDGKASTSHTHTLLTTLPSYVWSASTNGRDFNLGIESSFVRSADGYPDYGSVVRVATYDNDGSTAELYFPYSATYGGTAMRYRLGQYNQAGWTSWKTVLDDSNIGTYAWTSSNDGSGSGLDADLLDGQHGSYYLNTATTFGGDVSGTYNAIVVADDSHNHVISNVDGLQAALDGKLDNSYLSGRTITDANSADVQGITAYYLSSSAVNDPAGVDHALLTLNYSNAWSTQMASDWRTNQWYVRTQNSGTWGAWQNLWHDGNDGSGSGLDADLLDGQHGSYYYSPANAPDPTLTINGDASGSATFTNLGNATLTLTVADDSHNHVISNVDGLQTALDAKWPINGGAPTDLNLAGQGLWRINTGHTNQPAGTSYGTLLSFDNASDTGFQLASDYQGNAFYWRSGNASVYGGSGSFGAWRTIWHDGNDGSGSGLDADLLDGQHASAFASASHTHSSITSGGSNITSNSATWAKNNGEPNVAGQVFASGTGDARFMIHSGSGKVNVYTDGQYYANEGNYLVWNSGNDGSGSGLDADLLDGLNSTSFLRSDVVDAVYGLTTGTGSSWISQKDATNVAIQESNTESNGNTYRAFVRSKNSTYTYTLGRLSNSSFGFYGYINTRTANGTDFACYMDNSGNWTATGNVTAYSDERLKSNIKTIDNALDKVQNLRGVTFDKDGKAGLGVIAQEVQKVLPEVVQEGEEYLSVAYGNIVGVLIEAIKEQQKQIDELKAKMGAKA